MFAEEEDWSDGTEAHDTSKPIVNIRDDRKTVKSKGVAKKSLLRTLQTLGSVPDWINGDQGNASDSETDNVPVHTKRKKKRSKRRRKAATTEESAQDGNVTQTAIKVQPTEPMEKRIAIPAGTSKVMLTESKNVTGQDTKCVQLKRDGIEKLNRQQWRNKTKMKKKCVNKYRPSEGPKKDVLKPEAAKEYKAGESLKVSSDTKETDASQTSLPLKKSTQTEREGKARKGNKADKSNNITPIFDTLTRKKDLSKKSKLNSKGKTREPEPPVRLCESQEAVNKEKQVIPIKKPKLELNDSERRKRETLRRLLQDKVQGSKESPTELQHDEVAQEAPPNRSTALRSRMEQRLESARFRYINEVLYTSTSGEAKRMFKQDPHAFGIYHRGFTAQVQRWPANPVDAIISYIRQKPPSLVVADFGCGDCKIARSVKNKVHSFDLAQVCDLVTVCDMAHVPIDDCTVDIAVFCLSLMGTNLVDFLAEANRVLVMGGVLKVAEVASRFENTRSFLSTLAGLGFKLVSKDTKNSHFLSFDFEKSGDCPENTKKAGLELRPCVYKKR